MKKTDPLREAVKMASLLATAFSALSFSLGLWISSNFEPISPVDLVYAFRPWPKNLGLAIQVWLFVFLFTSVPCYLLVVVYEWLLSRLRRQR